MLLPRNQLNQQSVSSCDQYSHIFHSSLAAKKECCQERTVDRTQNEHRMNTLRDRLYIDKLQYRFVIFYKSDTIRLGVSRIDILIRVRVF